MKTLFLNWTKTKIDSLQDPPNINATFKEKKMKKTNLLILAAASLLGLAACGTTPNSESSGPAKGDETISGIEEFCSYFEDHGNYTMTYDDNNYDMVMKVNTDGVTDAVMCYYTDEAKDYGYVDSGYLTVKDKGVYSMYEDDDGSLYLSNIYSANGDIAPEEFYTTATIFAECGDEVWKDTDDDNVFETTNGKMKTLAAELCGWSGYEDYMTSAGVILTFDDVNDIKTAKLEFTLDCRADYEDEDAVFECYLTFSDFGTTEIEGLAELAKNPVVPDGVASPWDDEAKEDMKSVINQVLPTMDWSYASYCGLDSYDEFVLVDLKGAGKGTEYANKLKAEGWVLDEADSAADEDTGTYVYCLTKEFEATEDNAGGYYFIEIDDYSAEVMEASGGSYALLYPDGMFQFAVYAVEYTSYDEFVSIVSKTEYECGATVLAPSFESVPTNIVFSDQSVFGYLYYGFTEWYNFQGQFADYATSTKELEAWANSFNGVDKWTVDYSEYETYGYIYLFYDSYKADSDGDGKDDSTYCDLQVTIQVDLANETGAFMIDIEGTTSHNAVESGEEAE